MVKPRSSRKPFAWKAFSLSVRGATFVDMNRRDAVPANELSLLPARNAFFPFPEWWIRRRSAMLWSGRFVMVMTTTETTIGRTLKLSKKKIPFKMAKDSLEAENQKKGVNIVSQFHSPDNRCEAFAIH